MERGTEEARALSLNLWFISSAGREVETGGGGGGGGGCKDERGRIGAGRENAERHADLEPMKSYDESIN